MPTSDKSGPGRPKTGRKRVPVRLTNEECVRLDVLRRGKARGVYLGKLIMSQPADPFHAFRQLKSK